MNRSQKSQTVEMVREKFSKANAAFIAEYRGMTVESFGGLRKKVRLSQGEVRVVKNRLAKIAVKGTRFESLLSNLKGPVAIAFSYKDPVGVAKALSESISETSPFKIRIANLEGKEVSDKGVIALSKLPSREVLLSMMLGALKAPSQNFVNVLSAVPRNLANVLTDLKNKKEKQA